MTEVSCLKLNPTHVWAVSVHFTAHWVLNLIPVGWATWAFWRMPFLFRNLRCNTCSGNMSTSILEPIVEQDASAVLNLWHCFQSYSIPSREIAFQDYLVKSQHEVGSCVVMFGSVQLSVAGFSPILWSLCIAFRTIHQNWTSADFFSE